MQRYIATAAIVLVLGLCAAATPAAEIIMPGANLGGASADVDATAPAEAASGGAAHGAASGVDAAHRFLQPDASEARAENTGRASMGTDAGSAELTPKSHAHGRWQSLLPGVMK